MPGLKIGPGGGLATTGGGLALFGSVSSVLQAFTFTDTSSAGSDGFFRRGLAFPPGDVPSGEILQASIDGTPIRVSEMQRNTWSDGSLRSCILVGDAGPFSADQSKVVSVTSAAGSLGTSSISGGAVSFLAGLDDDCTVEIRNHTGSTNSTNVGNIDFSLQTALGTSSRVEIQEDTDVCVRLFCWQVVGSDVHLSCLHYVDIWLDEDGETPLAYEWTPVLSQHWWVDDPFGAAMTKQERNYDAECFNGATSLLDVDGLHHAYYCQWAGLRADDDAEHARRFWIDLGSTAMPTLLCEYSTASRIKMMKAGYLPPLDLGITWGATTGTEGYSPTDTYAPLGDTPGTEVLNHKDGINGTGGYNGRGIITHWDAVAIADQTADAWRVARVSAQASLAVFHHIKDHRNASGGAFDGDVSMGMFPQEMPNLGSQSYTGLASEGVFVSGTGSDIADDQPTAAVNAPQPTGYFTAWDDAHHTVYGYGMAFLEGERYLADAVLDQHNYVNMIGDNNGFYGLASLLWAIDGSDRATDLSLPSDTFEFVYIRHRQERSFGWTVLSLDHAYALLADGDRHVAWMDNALSVANSWLAASLDSDNLPADQLDTGTVWIRNPPEISSFMNTLSAQCFSRSIILHEGSLAGFTEYERLIMRYFRDTAIHNPYAVDLQNHMVCTDDTDAQTYVERDERYCSADSRTTLDNSGADTVWVFGNKFSPNILPEVGDVCQFNTASGLPLPIGINAGQDYFAVEIVSTPNSVSATVKLSATEGGAAISTTLPSGTQCRVCWKLPGYSQTQLGDNSTSVPGDDDFMTIAWAALEYHYGRSGAEISEADMTQIRTFFAPKSFSTFASWALDGDLIRS